MTLQHIGSLFSLVFCAAFASTMTAQQINRTVLPIPEPQPPTITELDARNAKAPPRFEVKAPKERQTSSSFCSMTSVLASATGGGVDMQIQR